VTDLPDVYLRFVDATPEIRGESSDAAYSGDDGWLSIKSFSFGFGWTDHTTAGLDDLRRQLARENDANKKELLQKKIFDLEKKQRDSAPTSGGNAKGDDAQQLKQREFSFTRNPGPASKDILAHIKKGMTEVIGAELIVCRAAGVQMPNGTPKDAKTPFLKFVFTEVELTKCQLQITRDQPPSESVEFWFKEIEMETIWTDNETGERITGGRNTIRFRFDDNTVPDFQAAQE